jgi:type I restriction enzyme, R subunit
MVRKNGLLHVLKKGLSLDDVHFVMMYPAPLASSAEQVKTNFGNNIFSSTRQVHYSLDNPGESIDLVRFINGLAFATLELKNPWTGQTARFHGQKQYRTQRDSRQPLLQFGRCLVHMAVDTDEVYMTTKLTGKSTFFLPFNKGHNLGAGNPPNKGGHKSAVGEYVLFCLYRHPKEHHPGKIRHQAIRRPVCAVSSIFNETGH